MPFTLWREFRVLTLLVGLVSGLVAGGEPEPEFQRDIAPLLTRHCLACHSGSQPKGGLDLTSHTSMMRGGEQGPVLQPGEAQAGLMWEYISSGQMPPKQPLEDGQRRLLLRWIALGAVWEGGPLDPRAVSTAERAGRDWWSLQPLLDAPPPVVGQPGATARTPLDLFLAARLAEQGLALAEDASPRDQVRRLFLDLVGIPPDPETVRRFQAEPTDLHYAQLVDRLLASPAYGERWARHWLDVARFGESDGFERNSPRDNFWQYRDWVIDALNQDMPYDEFVRWQIAGDVLGGNSAAGFAAAGFLVAGVHNTVVGSSESMRKLAREDELEEITAAVAQTFVGLTLNCARCHDHKFDPLTQQDYYRFTAALGGVAHGQREAYRRELDAPIEQYAALIRRLTEQLSRLESIGEARVLQQHGDSDTKPYEGPRPFARWEFEQDFQDAEGRLPGEAVGAARVEDGALVLDGASYVKTTGLPQEIREKTLEAWIQLQDLKQRGGAALSLQSGDGAAFDAIVFGEQEAGRWMAGSDLFKRTQSFQGPGEDSGPETPVQMAIVYSADGAIQAFRNGKPYGVGYASQGPVSFPQDSSRVLFGLRHEPPGGNRFLRGRILRAALYDRALTAPEMADCYASGSGRPLMAEILEALAPDQRQQHEQWSQERREAQRELTSLEKARKLSVYTVAPMQPPVRRVLQRGSIDAEGEIVAPGAVAALERCSGDLGLPPDAPEAERRLRLAQWMTDPENPLWTRVIVNRMWHYHFGLGLVATPNDLGFNGRLPSHPELLDWLARYLKQHQYRLKPLHRMIVTSTAYRQASAWRPDAARIDRDNHLLWRKSPIRLDAEALRDSILIVSGQLNGRHGGPGFQDVTIEYNNGTTYYEPFDRDDPELNRRTVYRFTPRGGRSGLLDAFDCPDPSSAAPRRTTTTTPLQALSLMNNALVLRMAQAMQRRVAEQAGPQPADQVRWAFWLTLGRAPDAVELQQSETLVRRHGVSALARVLFNTNEFVVAP